MEQTVVSSYVRRGKVKQPEQSNGVAYVIGAAIVILLAIIYWYITLPLGLSLGAAYGVKTIVVKNMPSRVVEAPTPVVDKPKRHYEKRIAVHHFQTNKVVRV